MWRTGKTLIVERSKIERCRLWAHDYVVGMELCPFASKALSNEKIQWEEVTDYTTLDSLIETFMLSEYESIFFILSNEKDFLDYLDVVELVMEVAATLGYREELTEVSFHPEHQYEGTQKDDVVNYANRAPFPMIQLLRKRDLENLGMNEEWKNRILSRNAEVLTEKGSDELNRMLNEYKR